MINPALCFIVPTRNRPNDIRSLLTNLSDQSAKPDQVIIVDSSDTLLSELEKGFPDLDIIHHAFDRDPSAAAQRSAGLNFVKKGMDLIGFVDDDMIFEEDALKNMLEFWQTSPEGICGAGFNVLSSDTGNGWTEQKLKAITYWLGLYPPGIGQVAPSGWHRRTEQVTQNTNVDWLITGAVVWLPKVFQKHQFDNFFKGYSYLEDLDFSYGLSRHHGLVVVADALVNHLHHHRELSSHWYYTLGGMEVRNRLYFVRKYKLSTWRCYLALTIRFGMTLAEFLRTGNTRILSRARGNLGALRTRKKQ